MNNPFMPNSGIPGPSSSPAPSSVSAPMPGASTAGADSFSIDLTEVSSGYTIPDGLYRLRCVEVEQTVSKSGNPMFVWTFEVNEGEHKGFQLKSFTAITPAAMWKVAETVEALGIGQIGGVVKFKRSDVLNKECGALVESSEYNGQNRSSITRTITLRQLAEVKNAG